MDGCVVPNITRYQPGSDMLPLEVQALFDFTRSQVTEQHVRDHSPTDPGYEDYVRVWTEILHCGNPPTKANFNLTEAIGLTSWETYGPTQPPPSFWEYFRFTRAVALALVHSGNDCEEVRPGSYLAYDLLAQCHTLDDPFFCLVQAVLPVTRRCLIDDQFDTDFSFFTLASMVLGDIVGDHEEVAWLAHQLIEDESLARRELPGNMGPRFLLDTTGYNLRNNQWLSLAQGLTNPRGEANLQLVIDTFTAISPEPRFPWGPLPRNKRPS